MMKDASESYLHAAARHVMLGWLRNASERAGVGNHVYFDDINWQVNRAGPEWGVWPEYPLVDDMRENSYYSWDEYNFSWSIKGDPDDGPKLWRMEGPSFAKTNPPIPTYEELVQIGHPPFAILDIAIQNKGCLVHGIEIVHKHDLTPKKMKLLEDIPRVWRVDARWVLGQIGEPLDFPDECLCDVGTYWEKVIAKYC